MSLCFVQLMSLGADRLCPCKTPLQNTVRLQTRFESVDRRDQNALSFAGGKLVCS